MSVEQSSPCKGSEGFELWVAARDALTWIENYPLNAGAEFRDEWATVVNSLAAALSDSCPPLATLACGCRVVHDWSGRASIVATSFMCDQHEQSGTTEVTLTPGQRETLKAGNVTIAEDWGGVGDHYV